MGHKKAQMCRDPVVRKETGVVQHRTSPRVDWEIGEKTLLSEIVCDLPKYLWQRPSIFTYVVCVNSLLDKMRCQNNCCRGILSYIDQMVPNAKY